MDLLVAYQNELLAVAAIFIVIYLYIIIKRKTTKRISHQEHEKELQAVIQHEEKSAAAEESKPLEQTEQTLPKEETISLEGQEEGDFGVSTNETAKTETKKTEHKKITKRNVPPHAKIQKEDFQEFSGQRILLAEDNIINQKVIQGLLADSGMEIIIANDGVEALEILEKDDNFMLILMDAHMPRMDGFETTAKIRANPKYDHIVVVALSGDTAADDVRKMNEAGMSEHLEKPLKMDALYDILYAYSPSEESDKGSGTFTELDIEEGLEISGNDVDFYHEILHEFINSYANAHDVIDTLIKHNKIESADKLLLDIIGVSANIGAQKLHQTALNLKTSLRDNDNKKSRLLFTFKEDLENLLEDIKNYL